MDIDTPYVAGGEAAETNEQGNCALDDLSISAQALVGVDAAAGDARCDPEPLAGLTTATKIIGLVGVQLLWPAPRLAVLAADGRNCVEHLFEGHAAVDVRPDQDEREENALAIRDAVVLRGGTVAIGRIQPLRGTPFFAAMEELSGAACQSRRRRQQVTPKPYPISMGSISEGMPLRSTKKMPLNAARAGDSASAAASRWSWSPSRRGRPSARDRGAARCGRTPYREATEHRHDPCRENPLTPERVASKARFEDKNVVGKRVGEQRLLHPGCQRVHLAAEIHLPRVHQDPRARRAARARRARRAWARKVTPRRT